MQPQVQVPGKWPSCEGEGRRGLGPTGVRTEQTQGGLLMRVNLGKNRLLEARKREEVTIMGLSGGARRADCSGEFI